MTDKVAVVTGASAGIGAAAARELHKQGWTVHVVGRNPAKTAAVAKDVGTEPFVADFADLAQVRRLAGELLERVPQIDLLANNAGGTWPDRRVTADGHELTFQANHLAPYLLTRLLKDRLVASQARIVQTSSTAHGAGRLDLADLDSTGGFKSGRAYGTSKLENILFTRELQRRWGAEGIRAAAYHPGVVASEFGRDSRLLGLAYRTPVSKFFVSNEGGADTLVWLATTDDDWLPGGYFIKRKLGKTSKQAGDDELARGLWARSAELVGLGDGD